MLNEDQIKKHVERKKKENKNLWSLSVPFIIYEVNSFIFQ